MRYNLNLFKDLSNVILKKNVTIQKGSQIGTGCQFFGAVRDA